VKELRARGARVPASLAAIVAMAVTILGIGALGLVDPNEPEDLKGHDR
jgi:hypothetical protein